MGADARLTESFTMASITGANYCPDAYKDAAVLVDYRQKNMLVYLFKHNMLHICSLLVNQYFST